MAMKDVLEKVQDLIDELTASSEKEGAKMARTNNVSAAKRLRLALLDAGKQCKEIRKLLMVEIKETQSQRSEKRGTK